MEITYFPFDVQACTINFGSGIYQIYDINFKIFATDNVLYNYTENKLWDLVSKKAYETTSVRIGMVYKELRYQITIKRKALYTITNIVIPALILSAITVVTFFIPFPQAISIGISVILSYSVLSIRYMNFLINQIQKINFILNLIRLNDSIPVQSEVLPLLVLYFIICMFLTLGGMMSLSFLNRMKEKKIIPKILKNFSVYLLTLIFSASKSRKEIIRSYEKLVNPRPKIITVAVSPQNANRSNADTEEKLPEEEMIYMNAEQLDSIVLSFLNSFCAMSFISAFILLNLTVLILIPAVKSPNS